MSFFCPIWESFFTNCLFSFPRFSSSLQELHLSHISTFNYPMSAPSIHADPPPEVVVDPEGLQYETGPQLGKGGFAICHRAKLMRHEHLGSNTVALKIVRSKMEPPKLAQKVSQAVNSAGHFLLTRLSLSQNYRFTPSWPIRTLSNSTAPFRSDLAHMSFWSCAKMAPSLMPSRRENISPCPKSDDS